MRKGELSKHSLDHGWPHQVTMLADRCTGEQHTSIGEFCRGLSLAPRGHTYVEGGAYHNVYCFAVEVDALAFAARFGGRIVDPATRPRWGKTRRAKAG